ncbi:MAG: 4Fe-4S binding protein [Gammaproteobacteria bacterium]|nr:4Fe-4S binding protein [Gammaproteobacteria bacterium]
MNSIDPSLCIHCDACVRFVALFERNTIV